ncbi:MAG: glutamine--fructose-6-phosphate transaminase (isomerizing), partial [Tissierellia bacterium]|nr:glutamine--fructose-6-phosphate transaminase (isomerizing) [Tissierellia bacterium]
MCGIVCYKGRDYAKKIILDGLKKLEYRGYDSAGIALKNEEIECFKKSGRIENLKEILKDNSVDSHIGIGHIRWATHGEANDVNSHPHVSEDQKIAVVHNGIIENYRQLKEDLIKEGYNFKSETDTEVIAALISKYYDSDLLEAVNKAIKLLEGSFAIGVIAKDEDRLVAVRNQSPLVMGVLEDGHILASDIPSLLEYTKDVIYLDEGDIVDLNGKNCTIYDKELNILDKKIDRVTWSMEDATKEGYDHFMIKEINEQPTAIIDCLRDKIHDRHLDLKDNSFSKEEIENFKRIYIIACGTAYNAGMVGKYAFEKFAKIPVICDIASEFRYNDPFVDENTLVILLSQSGETADTLAALRESKKNGAKTIAITNVVGSSIARESDKVIYLNAGPEIAVASTKAYTTQIVSMYTLALDFCKKLNIKDDKWIDQKIQQLSKVSEKIEEILKNQDSIKEYAKKIKDKEHVFYIGRLLDFCTVTEGALKLKEVSYIHCEAFAAGELKHGTIALIEENTPVVSVITQDNIMDKTISNIEEVVSRGADVFIISKEDNSKLRNISSFVYKLPEINDWLYPILSVVCCQLLAYYTSKEKGLDV